MLFINEQNFPLDEELSDLVGFCEPTLASGFVSDGYQPKNLLLRHFFLGGRGLNKIDGIAKFLQIELFYQFLPIFLFYMFPVDDPFRLFVM